MTISEMIIKLQEELYARGDVPVFYLHYGAELKEVESIVPYEHWNKEKQCVVNAIELC